MRLKVDGMKKGVDYTDEVMHCHILAITDYIRLLTVELRP